MNIWFLLWLLLSGALLYFFGWTLFILHRQKLAWRDFAGKRKLRFQPRAFLEAPEISGLVDDYSISLFTAEHAAPDARSNRKMTAFEIKLKSRMPFAGGIASGGMVPLVQRLGLREEYRPASAAWKDSYIASGDSRAGLESYLTPPRLAALEALMQMKNAWVIFVFRDDVSLLRLDMADPLDSAKKLEFVTRKMIETARVLEIES